MPRYYFHLRFGQRVLADEEGIELSNRTAARDEALAVVRDLAKPEVEGSRRRWAGWFLQVADGKGQFFRTPIGHPALELATSQDPAEERSLLSPAAPAQQAATSAPTQVSELVRELSARQQHATQLLEHSCSLQQELSSLCASNQRIRAHARDLVAYARHVTAKNNDVGFFWFAKALARRSSPHLVVLPGV